jgi:two-component sensor histidine kinase
MNLEISVSDPFVEADLDVFREVADSLAIALHQARLHEQLQLDAQVKANLLQEVNHRVSNNLTAIIGLMRAERRYARSQNRATVEAMVERLTQRVEGMVAVHRLLSQSQWMPVRLDRLAEQVVGAALGILVNEQSVEVSVEASDVRVSPRQASNLAMILNELTTNTIKHAMAGRTGGRIEVRISGEEQIQLEYRDDGPAYPDAVLALEQTDVGLYLVQQLVLGLPGRLELRNEDGAVAAIVFEGEERDRT